MAAGAARTARTTPARTVQQSSAVAAAAAELRHAERRTAADQTRARACARRTFGRSHVDGQDRQLALWRLHPLAAVDHSERKRALQCGGANAQRSVTACRRAVRHWAGLRRHATGGALTVREVKRTLAAARR